MSETTEGAAKSYLSKNVRLKRDKLIFFVLNLLVIMPYAVTLCSPWGCAGAVVILVLLFVWTVALSDNSRPASWNLPVFGFLDACILLGLSYQELIDYFNPDDLVYFIQRMEDRPYPGAVLAAALVLAVAADVHLRKGPLAVWLGMLGRTVAGGALIWALWCGGTLLTPRFLPGMNAFFAFYVLCAMGWCILCAAAYYVDSKSAIRSICLSWLLLAAFFTLCLTEAPLVQLFAGTLEERFLALPDMSFAWWRALSAAAVLTGCAIAVYDYDNHKMGADSLVLGALASGVLLLRILLSWYFAFSFLVFPVFLAGCFRCLYNERRQSKTLRLSSPAYLIAQMAALALAVHLLKTGLWVLTVLICVYAAVFYATAGKNSTAGYRLCHWITILSCPAVLAAGYIWQMRFVRESCVLVGTAYVIFACFILVLSWPHPDDRKSPDIYKWSVCGFMTLLCLMAAARYGSKIQVAFRPEDSTAVITLEARGEDNRIRSAVLSWTSLTGEALSGEIPLSAGENTVPIRGERLIISATDAFGATTTVTDWYPGWLLERK